MSRYSYDIEKAGKYDVVLVIAQDNRTYESIKAKLYSLNQWFCARSFIITEVNMLKDNLCFYENKIMTLQEAVRQVKEKDKIHARGI